MKRALAGLFWIVLGLALWLPVDFALGLLDLDRMQRMNVIASLALIGFLYGCAGVWRHRWVWTIITLSALIAVLIRLTYLGLIHFSGAGFTEEFFIHFEWQSMLVVAEEYGPLLVIAIVGILLLVYLAWLARKEWSALSFGKSLTLMVLSLAALGTLRAVLPEWQLIRGWQEWNRPIVTEIDPDIASSFAELGLVETDLIAKRRLRAAVPEQPKNLILLYLESVGLNLAGREDWPGLMPNLERLLDEHAWLDHVWTSSYITIEGITNSQCGTLFPFGRGSDSLAEGDGLADHLPCLGDVLAAAGYHQVYMGGAGMSFAGKGNFLAAHGYDELKGLEYWSKRGLAPRSGKWGLSDPELLSLSIEEVHRLRARGLPFNLTMLTIGTHLPGYLYRECEPYFYREHRFLDALHCTDQLLGRWIDRLRDEGLLENSVLVITADHHVFPSPEMRELFGDDVLDRRLPLIVLGDSLPEPAQIAGAGYDLAPTVLDLLGVKHNARFILGRSLVDGLTRPHYFVKRYADVHDEVVINNGEVACREGGAGLPELPLSACDKRDLLNLIGGIKVGLSSGPARVQCDLGGEFSHMTIPLDAAGSLQVVIGGEDQSDRFIFQSRQVNPSRRGLYLMAFAENGELLARRFLPLSEEAGPEAIFGEIQAELFVVAQHLGGLDAVTPAIDVFDGEGLLLMRRSAPEKGEGLLRLEIGDLLCL